MNRININDTIVAISTPIGQAGIGIVRLSGKDSLKIIDKIFKGKDGVCPSRLKSHTVRYGWVLEKSKIIDEVLLTVMRKPKTYTKEDIVEINCHSGIVNLRKVLDLVLKSGARLAEPGEFTKRAFLNGRIDLTQAEAVLDIIQAKTEASLKISVEQLKGELSAKINSTREILLDVLANLEASIDFPEEDIKTDLVQSISKKIANARDKIKNLLKDADKGKILREGIRVVICGKPNVGKSSLLNAILKEERAIVTPIPGTTRDVIEETINLKGIPLRFFDTAGIIKPKDLVEQEAVKRAKNQIESAELILLVLDGSRVISKEDKDFIRQLREKRKIIVVNKIDLPQKIDISQLRALGLNDKIIKISALKGQGLKELEDNIVQKIWPDRLTGSEEIIVSNIRHIELLRKSFEALDRAKTVINNGLSAEFISLEIKQAAEYLDSIIGKSIGEDLLDKIFSEFCIGK